MAEKNNLANAVSGSNSSGVFTAIPKNENWHSSALCVMVSDCKASGLVSTICAVPSAESVKSALQVNAPWVISAFAVNADGIVCAFFTSEY